MSLNLSRRDLLVTGGAATTMATVPGTMLAQAESRTSDGGETGGLPDNERKINIVTLRDLEAEARKLMTPFGCAYVSGGAGDEWTMRENLAAFNRWVINGDFMSGNGAADTTTTILGVNISYPAITAPLGNQGSVHVQKDCRTSRELQQRVPSSAPAQCRR
jgi:L-lactate oxidase